ncbi:caspase family protein [Pseudogemmobacter bohemicus]|uniref:caspase family protein n=1 Tax=Pseudogemmobacter bohemicus TaxID=2250708 RepID=UPI0018E4DD88|nr:caspase family protein [Pseudogemmobacter bohemicus]
MKPHLTYALAAGLLFWSTSLQAETRAVLIGVGEYAFLDADLKGPTNDVRLMVEVLAGRGVAPEAMTVLTTDPTGLPRGVLVAEPTRAGILAALDAAAAGSAPGDTLVFYFSGHGSQAPDQNGDEGGGYDEIFLPMDAKNWQGEIGMVENALVDDELNLWAQAVLDRDVRLVGIIDACYSATGFRAIEPDPAAGVARSLQPDALGIPDDLPAAPSVPPFTGATELAGDFVFLYSSQSDERSFEYPLGDTGIWHGEFTLRLAQVLAGAEDATWQQVLAATSDSMIRGVARQLPDAEGTLLNEKVFGEGAGSARYRVTGATLEAGLLQGFAEGGEVTLYASGAGGESIGSAILGKVSAREAKISGPLPELAPDQTLWAAPGRLPDPKPLVLAAPARADAGDGFDYSQWETALAALPQETVTPDLVPVLTAGQLVLAGPDGVVDPDGAGSSPRVLSWDGETESEALQRVLDTMAHATRLRDVLATAAGRGLTKSEVISVAIERRQGEELSDPAGGASCSGQAGAGMPHDPALGVSGCDQLWLRLTNRSGKAQDVTVLYLTAGMEVLPIWPAQNIANRIAPGEAARVGLQIDPVSHAAIEEIWILAVPMGETQALRTDLTSLATATMRGSSGSSETALWLESQIVPMDDSALRGFSTKPADLTMIRQIVRLQPPASDRTAASSGPVSGP